MKRCLTLGLLFLLLLCGCSRQEPAPTLEPESPANVTLSTFQGVPILEGKVYAELFDAMLRSAVEQNLDDAPPRFYQVDLTYSDGSTVDFVLFPDPVSENVYLVEHGKTFRAARQYAEEFLALDVMAPAYLPPVDYRLDITSPVKEVTSFVREYDFTYLIPSGWKSIRSVEDASMQAVDAVTPEELSFAFTEEPDDWTIRYYREEDGHEETDPGPGSYLCRVTANYTEASMGRYSGTILFEFLLTLHGDPVLSLSEDATHPGGVLALRIQHALPGMQYSLTGTHTHAAIPLWQEDTDTLLALIPVGPDVVPGHHTLFLSRTSDRENTAVITGSSVSFSVSPRSGQAVSAPAEADADHGLHGLQQTTLALLDRAETDALLPAQPFSLPDHSAVSIAYGAPLHSDGADEPVRYHGVQLAVSAGAEIVAPADGTVCAIESLDDGSNLILLDHGCGLVSVYAWLTADAIAVGSELSSGDRLGSPAEPDTGPSRLHYAVYIGSTPVDPAALESAALWSFLQNDQ